MFVFLPGAEAIKGGLVGATGYPTRFGKQGEYLVFLYRTGAGATVLWTMLAAYRVRYYPNEFGGMFSIRAGSTVGLLASRPAVTITQARMDAFFRASLLPAVASCDSMEPFLMDWPHFPLTVGSGGAGKKPLLHEAVTQTGTAEGAGIRVVLRTGRETAAQTWLPGDPWYRSAERDGLRKSRLVVGKQRHAHQVE